jgi:hypothetical protein
MALLHRRKKNIFFLTPFLSTSLGLCRKTHLKSEGSSFFFIVFLFFILFLSSPLLLPTLSSFFYIFSFFWFFHFVLFCIFFSYDLILRDPHISLAQKEPRARRLRNQNTYLMKTENSNIHQNLKGHHIVKHKNFHHILLHHLRLHLGVQD